MSAGAPHVRDVLFERPWSFSFFQAVRLLHRFDTFRHPLGSFERPSSHVARIGVPTTIAFPASEVQALQPAGSAAPELSVNFLGLIGPQGVLPYWYSIVIDEAGRSRNHAAKAFLDIFQHRMLSHFYRAWEHGHHEVAWERGGEDSLEPVVRASAGVGSPGLQHRMGIADASLMFYSGLLGPTQRSAIGLEQLLCDYFDLPIRVEQFVGGWFALDRSAMLSLDDESPSAELGIGSVIGDAIWNEQARARIRIGPLKRADFERFLPSGLAYSELQELVRFYSDDAVEFELQLVMRRDDVKGTSLGDSGALPLGWGSWMAPHGAAEDKADVVFVL